MLFYSVIVVVGVLNLALGYWAAVRLGFGPQDDVAACQSPVTASFPGETADAVTETVLREGETVQDEMLADAIAEPVGSSLAGLGDRSE